MEVDLHQLDLRHDDLRIRGGDRQRRLIASVAELGQQVPVTVSLVGNDNTLTYKKGIASAKPKVQNVGTHNTATQIK